MFRSEVFIIASLACMYMQMYMYMYMQLDMTAYVDLHIMHV